MMPPRICPATGGSCEPDTDLCYYTVTVGLCDGPNPQKNRPIFAAAAKMTGVKKGRKVVGRPIIIDHVSEKRLADKGIPIIYEIKTGKLPKAKLSCKHGLPPGKIAKKTKAKKKAVKE